MSRRPRSGDPAPDFTLEGPDGPFTLSAQRGRPVVLLFYPGDDTPVCTRQFCSYRDQSDALAALDAVVVGISRGDVEGKRRFARRHGLTVPLLADADGAVGRAYGVDGPLGTRRATVVVDERGRVGASRVHALGLRYESVDDLAELLGAVPS